MKRQNGKVIYALERHRYAPELNRVHYMDGTIDHAPHCKTVEEVEEFLGLVAF